MESEHKGYKIYTGHIGQTGTGQQVRIGQTGTGHIGQTGAGQQMHIGQTGIGQTGYTVHTGQTGTGQSGYTVHTLHSGQIGTGQTGYTERGQSGYTVHAVHTGQTGQTGTGQSGYKETVQTRPLENKLHKQQRDLIYENDQRKLRLQSISAQLDEQCRLIVESSELIDKRGQEIADALHNFRLIVRKVFSLIPQDQAQLVSKLNSLLARLNDLSQSIQVIAITGSPGFLIPKYIFQLISGAAVTYGMKAVRNAYIKKVMIKQGEDFTDKAVRKAFIQKMSTLFKWGTGSVSAFLTGTIFTVALDFFFAAITGAIEKNQLQALLRESLDCRYYSTRAKLINQISRDCFLNVSGIIQGGQGLFDMIDVLLESNNPEFIQMAYEQLAKTGIEETLDRAITDIKKVDHALITKTLASMDKGAWKDDFQSAWQPTSEQEYQSKYPPPE